MLKQHKKSKVWPGTLFRRSNQNRNISLGGCGLGLLRWWLGLKNKCMKLSKKIAMGSKLKRKKDGVNAVVAFLSHSKNSNDSTFNECAFLDVEGEQDRVVIHNLDEWDVVDEIKEPVKEESNTGYAEVGETIEKYMPINWYKLKLGDQVADLIYKPAKKGKVHQMLDNSNYLVGVHFGREGVRLYTVDEVKERLRLVVKPTDGRYPDVDDLVSRPHHQLDPTEKSVDDMLVCTVNQDSAKLSKPTQEEQQTFYLRQIAIALWALNPQSAMNGKELKESLDKELSEWHKTQ